MNNIIRMIRSRLQISYNQCKDSNLKQIVKQRLSSKLYWLKDHKLRCQDEIKIYILLQKDRPKFSSRIKMISNENQKQEILQTQTTVVHQRNKSNRNLLKNNVSRAWPLVYLTLRNKYSFKKKFVRQRNCDITVRANPD